MTNPITASRERIVSDFDNTAMFSFPANIQPGSVTGYVEGTNGEPQVYRGKPENVQDYLRSALLQHEATVKEEMARIVEGIKQPDDPHSPYWQLGFERAKKTAAQAIRTTQPTI